MGRVGRLGGLAGGRVGEMAAVGRGKGVEGVNANVILAYRKNRYSYSLFFAGSFIAGREAVQEHNCRQWTTN